MDANGESQGCRGASGKAQPAHRHPKRLAAMAYLNMYNAANQRLGALNIVQ
jgi:hypothetical protein